MYREIASEDGSMNSILEVRSTYPKCRHPECLEVKIGCLEPAGFHSSQLLQYLTRTTTKWPAGTTDVGRGVGVAIRRTSSTRGSEVTQDTEETGGWKGWGCVLLPVVRQGFGGKQKTSNLSTMILYFNPENWGNDPIWLAHVFFFTWVSWNHQLETNDGKWWVQKKTQRRGSGRRKHQVSWFAKLSSSL